MIVADIVKFYGCELGAQTKYDKKDGTSIVNGAHDTTKLCELLEVGCPAFTFACRAFSEKKHSA